MQDITVGYGYRPARAPLWLAALLALGTVVFAVAPPAPFTGTQVPPFNPLIYTLNLLLPVVDFGQARAYDPRGPEQWLLRPHHRRMDQPSEIMQIFEGTNQIQRLVISRDLAKG